MRQRPLLRIGSIILLATMLVLAACSSVPSSARLPFPFKSSAQTVADATQPESEMPRPQLPTNRMRAPEFPRDFAWVNTDRPLFMQGELRGRIVVLDFWTYCCINCMHILPDLEYIEHKYVGQPVVVIGVHSAKFDNEGDQNNILTACHRYDIAHPVIVDENHRIWTEYGVRAWPTLAIVDAEGRMVGQLSGEGNREILDGVISALLEEGREKGVLASGPPEFKPASRVPSASGLAFPGKVFAQADRVFVADSNHDRVIIADSSGQVLAIAGSGKKGQADGAFENAEFDNPQGMAWDSERNLLYVADTDNHLVRKLDIGSKTVTTISGTGEQVYDRTGGGIGTAQGLNSPWDLVLDSNTLYIAMAGPHQLWTLDLPTGVARAWAGSGSENIKDGTGTRSAALAQPSGLARDGDWLYFADSEVSAVRRANLKDAEVQTLVGSGLFDFGDQVGGFNRTLLQHPLGVAVYKGDVLVADTYNNKIKRLDVANKLATEFIGSGNPDRSTESLKSLSLHEPGGVSVNGDWLYIADTNHDRVIRVSLADGAWSEFALRGLRSMESVMQKHDVEVTTTIPYSGGDLALSLGADLPRGVHLNKEAPLAYVLSGNGRQIEGLAVKPELPVRVVVPEDALRGGDGLSAMLSLSYCTDEDAGLCVPISIGWTIKLDSESSAPKEAILTAQVKDLPR
ncbi:MAG: redoxin domain-containing protein [Calditrichaeota bacterium]|nr:redoxin domain-containing protein [Calditrichota bacterium]